MPDTFKGKVLSFASTRNTGFEYPKGTETDPGRFKFYLSVNEAGEGKRGQQFVDRLMQLCTEKKISLQTKIESHNYDGLLLYTWHREELTQILDEIYPEFVDIFQDVPRVFHAPFGSVPVTRIGWVQEPFSPAYKKIRELESHSGRMRKLGAILDGIKRDRGSLTIADYREACGTVGVRSDYPWLIQKNLLKTKLVL